MIDGNGMPWYAAGLCFECQLCGACCSGPDEGYIWVTRPEIQLIADFLKLDAGKLRRDYLKRVGSRTTIIEQPTTKDCIFLREIDGKKRCMIYPVRPSQCRNWPFWPENLKNPTAWNSAGQKCPGVNQGKIHGLKEIETLKNSRKWWENDK